MNPEAYVYIAAWGRQGGASDRWIEEQQGRALADHAPADALYKCDAGTWVCRSDIPEHHKALLDQLDTLAGRVRGG